METEVLAKGVRPFWGRIALVESPLTEEERTSGLILPIVQEGDEVKRGVVQAVDDYGDSDLEAELAKIPPGTVVYYEAAAGQKIRDLVLLRLDKIVAYEP